MELKVLRIGWRIKATMDKSHVILKMSDARIHGIKPFANKSAKILQHHLHEPPASNVFKHSPSGTWA